MNELMTLIREAGGGLVGIVIVVQGLANWVQYKRNSDLQDKLLSMAETSIKESRELLTDTNKATNASGEIMRRAVQLLEDRRDERRRLDGRR